MRAEYVLNAGPTVDLRVKDKVELELLVRDLQKELQGRFQWHGLGRLKHYPITGSIPETYLLGNDMENYVRVTVERSGMHALVRFVKSGAADAEFLQEYAQRVNRGLR